MKFRTKEQAERMIVDTNVERVKPVWGGFIIEYKCKKCGYWNECINNVYICVCGADL